jgi:divalent metal cation (Fe/Co/Zn/Cd) transporter
MVGVLLFIGGACVSIWQGVHQMLQPRPLDDVTVAYVVLALSVLFEGASWWVAFRNFRKRKRGRSLWRAVRESKDPPAFMVLFEDSAALIGIAIAFVGIWISKHYHLPVVDGAASVLIGLVLAGAALIVARESKGLLIGEQASQRICQSILDLASTEAGVEKASGPFTIHLAPDEIVAALDLEFCDDFRAPQIERSVESLERRVRDKHPEVVALFVKPKASKESSG